MRAAMALVLKKTPPATPLSRTPSAAVAAVAAVAAACYYNSLDGAFLLDDEATVVRNRDVSAKGAVPFSNYFQHDFWGKPSADGGSHMSWRPLTTMTFRLNHQWQRARTAANERTQQ